MVESILHSPLWWATNFLQLALFSAAIGALAFALNETLPGRRTTLRGSILTAGLFAVYAALQLRIRDLLAVAHSTDWLTVALALGVWTAFAIICGSTLIRRVKCSSHAQRNADPAAEDTPLPSCPHCRQWVHPGDEFCPHCKMHVEPHRPVLHSALLMLLVLFVSIAMTAVLAFLVLPQF